MPTKRDLAIAAIREKRAKKTAGSVRKYLDDKANEARHKKGDKFELTSESEDIDPSNGEEEEEDWKSFIVDDADGEDKEESDNESDYQTTEKDDTEDKEVPSPHGEENLSSGYSDSEAELTVHDFYEIYCKRLECRTYDKKECSYFNPANAVTTPVYHTSNEEEPVASSSVINPTGDITQTPYGEPGPSKLPPSRKRAHVVDSDDDEVDPETKDSNRRGSILVKRFDKGAPMPKRQKKGDVGFDLTSREDLVLEPGQIKVVSVGIGFGFQTGVYGQTFSRSGMAIKGLTVIPGVIDTGYAGEVGAMMHNIGTSKFIIKIGDRIAQIVPIVVSMAPLVLVDELPKTERGDKGFGSTGVNEIPTDWARELGY